MAAVVVVVVFAVVVFCFSCANRIGHDNIGGCGSGSWCCCSSHCSNSSCCHC